MTSKTDKQLFQIQNILETLIEATDHFMQLVKREEFNQSIFMFGSIVEGLHAVKNILVAESEELYTSHFNKLERSTLFIAQCLEQGNYMKIVETVQFALRPQIINLKQTFIQVEGIQQIDGIITIGVFHAQLNPLKIYTKERIDAMVKESIKQNTILYFFTSDDIDFDNKQVSADTFQDNLWVKVTVPFPDVINNIGAGQRTQTERNLSRMIPFTSFYVGNKYTLPKRMAKYRKFTELLVPFRVCTGFDVINDFLNKNDRVVFKSLGSNRGENIYFITKKGSRYILLDQKKERILSNEEFNNFINRIILGEKNAYIIQKYIHTRTKADEPYHFRSHVQKNGEGKWQITHIYPRIGNKKSNLSNISTEGRIEDFPKFLQKEFGKNQGAKFEKKILQLSIDIVLHLDKLYGFALNELGLDFTIDDEGKIWMHEANNGPQTAFHEEKRAINTIAYARYIAENGIMYSNAISNPDNEQFQARNSNLPIAADDKKELIGMLTGAKFDEKLAITLFEIANKSQLQFFYFKPKDIDFDRELIKGYFYVGENWIPKVVSYPDVIIDNIKLRGKQEANYIYEELGEIPFTNEWPFYSKIRSSIYQCLQKNDKTKDKLANFQKIKSSYDVIRYIENFNKIYLKPEDTTLTHLFHNIEKVNTATYLLTKQGKSKEYSEIQLKSLINDLIEKGNFIVQEDTKKEQSLQMQLHLMKDCNLEWVCVDKSFNDKHRFNKLFDGITDGQHIDSQIIDEAIDIAKIFEKESDQPVSELIVALVVNKEQKVKIQEINPNGIIEINEKDKILANTLITYAKSLIRNRN